MFAHRFITLLLLSVIAATCEAADGEVKVDSSATNDAMTAAAARLRKIIVDNAAGANKPNVYVDVFGKVTWTLKTRPRGSAEGAMSEILPLNVVPGTASAVISTG